MMHKEESLHHLRQKMSRVCMRKLVRRHTLLVCRESAKKMYIYILPKKADFLGFIIYINFFPMVCLSWFSFLKT